MGIEQSRGAIQVPNYKTHLLIYNDPFIRMCILKSFMRMCTLKSFMRMCTLKSLTNLTNLNDNINSVSNDLCSRGFIVYVENIRFISSFNYTLVTRHACKIKRLLLDTF